MSGNIYIPKPCHENWNNMSTEEKGRHCLVCSKVVKDFTKMEKSEIIEELKKTTGEVCGRINSQQVTPIKSQQKLHIFISDWLYRKAIYPVMALLGLSLTTKKATAQVDYPIMGKVAFNDYHTRTKKITVVVVSESKNRPLPMTNINVVGGVRNTPNPLRTDSKGRAIIEINPDNLNGEEIQIEVYAPGFEPKIVTIQLVKDVQTVEIKMDAEIMIMGEMMYVPDEVKPIENAVIQPDTSQKIEVIKCNSAELIKLPYIKKEDIEIIEFVDDVFPANHVETNTLLEDVQPIENPISLFNVYPVPANDVVNIITEGSESFNLDLFDEN